MRNRTNGGRFCGSDSRQALTRAVKSAVPFAVRSVWKFRADRLCAARQPHRVNAAKRGRLSSAQAGRPVRGKTAALRRERGIAHSPMSIAKRVRRGQGECVRREHADADGHNGASRYRAGDNRFAAGLRHARVVSGEFTLDRVVAAAGGRNLRRHSKRRRHHHHGEKGRREASKRLGSLSQA
jgi:hypothetical protein